MCRAPSAELRAVPGAWDLPRLPESRRFSVKKSPLLAFFVGLLVSTSPLFATENTWDYSVQVSARVQTMPPQIVLSWPNDAGNNPAYTVYRKNPQDLSWGSGTHLRVGANSYLDTNVVVGVPYEYQVVRRAAQHAAYGYLYAGIQVTSVEERGKLLLVVDQTYAGQLSNELAQLEEDLTGDGWTVLRLAASRTDSVPRVKESIVAAYRSDPSQVKCVFLFGHVPVPYSGNIVPDGHAPDHQGAWPCDGFYGDMDGHWTDRSVNVVIASDPRNRNTPGDGKFDQSTFPALLKLMVGRVDLANMPGRTKAGGPPTFPSELELLRNYLVKDHKFRTGQFEVPRRGVVGDYFGIRDGEAFAASGWRNFAAFFGPANVSRLANERTWIQNLGTNAYLWAYGCGPGTYTSIGGLGTANSYNDGVTTELVQADVKTVFAMLFGSWLGDWDSEDDLQRAVLATQSYGLACAWSGRPHWFLQHMALGAPIGYSTLLTQNNRDGLYRNEMNNGAGQIHIALMGDPTLRMHVVPPPTDLEAKSAGADLELTWESTGSATDGYNIYRADKPQGPYERLNATPVKGTSFLAENPSPASKYMVRALRLETSGSGTYYNLSQGSFVTPLAEPSEPSVPAIAAKTETPRLGSEAHVDASTSGSTNSPPTSTGRGPTTAL
jgi:hypothetical protein